MPVLDRLRNAWNAFRNGVNEWTEIGPSSEAYYGSRPPSRQRLNFYSERSIVSSIYTRISVDVSGILIKHIKLDDQNRYLQDVKSSLNDCLTLEANIDQSPRAFRQDVALTLFDKGVAAVVPVDVTRDPQTNEVFDIYTLRVGEIITWYPKHVKLSVYNENKGRREDVTLEKRFVAIIENPLYSVMNEPNSTLQRLIRKLTLLDTVDEQSGSGKLDLIIQLPYVIKSEARKQQAEQRRADIEFQLKGSQYGIAYTDGTEKITQLNRPAENNLLKQVEYLTALLYNQLGLTEEVMNGTASEEAMLLYFSRTIEPLIDAIVESMQRAFLGPPSIRKNERIKYFRDPFKLVPVKEIAEIADKFTRNEILTANEIRQYMGIPPSGDPKADKLVNSNMPQPAEAVPVETEEDTVVNEALSSLDTELDTMLSELGGT
jgi:Phage portal protein